jgi:RNA-directed DNA polymerase
VHEAVKSYRKNVTIKDNAKCHAASNFLLRVDLKDFFQSIKAHDIVSHLHVQHPDWSEDDIDLFRQLVCRRGQLTIGAPSSPAISNAICYEMDLRLAEHAKQNKSTYTRYADDLFFSTDAPDVLRHFPDAIQAVLNGLPRPRSLLLNPEKTRHSSRRGRRRVTGLTLGSDGNVHLGRALKRTIRARIHTLKALDERERTALAGLIAYAQMIDPDFISALVLKYGPAKVQEACQR